MRRLCALRVARVFQTLGWDEASEAKCFCADQPMQRGRRKQELHKSKDGLNDAHQLEIQATLCIRTVRRHIPRRRLHEEAEGTFAHCQKEQWRSRLLKESGQKLELAVQIHGKENSLRGVETLLVLENVNANLTDIAGRVPFLTVSISARQCRHL